MENSLNGLLRDIPTIRFSTRAILSLFELGAQKRRSANYLLTTVLPRITTRYTLDYLE